MSAKPRYLALESLRGVAALSVVLFHFDIGSHFHSGFTDQAWFMVDFFFVLSGFVIALNYQTRISDARSFWTFQKKRFWRLYPLHIVMLLVYLGIECAKYLAQVKFGLMANAPAFTTNNAESFFYNLLLAQNWLLPGLSWNFPSWSISAEFYTYAVFGLVAFVTRKRPGALLIASSIVVAMGAIVLFITGFETNNVAGPSRCLFAFFIGVLTFNALEKLGLGQRFQGSAPAVATLAISIFAVSISESELVSAYWIAMPCLFAIAILAVTATRETAHVIRVLSAPKFVYLGTISYGIYMIHAAVLWIFTQTARFVFGLPTEVDAEGKTKVLFDNIFVADAVVVFALACILFLAHLSYLHIETRFTRR